MANIKERTIGGKKYVYVSTSATFKGETKTFEKSIGPEDLDKDILERRKKFYTSLFQAKRKLHMIYLETKNTELEQLPKGYALPLVIVKNGYQEFMSELYPNDLEKYKEQFEIRYVYNTTSIEGNTLTLRETAMVLDDGIAPKTKELREIHEVENYVRLREYMDTYKRDINKTLILKIHEFIQRNIDDDSAGCFRRIPVGISGSEWEPPPAPAVEEEMDELLAWYDENKKQMHPVELGGLFHHKFLQTHPFKDGNGRVARELLNFILQRNDFPPIVISTTQSFDYFNTLGEADNGNITPLLEFISSIMIEDSVTAMNNISDEIRAIVGELTSEERSEILTMIMEYITLIFPYIMTMPEDVMSKISKIMGFSDDSNPFEAFQQLGLLSQGG